jgi:hypothetical protein
LLIPGVKTGAIDQLSAASGADFLIATHMMDSAWDYIAFGTAEPGRKMECFGIIGDSLKDLPIRVFNEGISFTGGDR